MTDQRLEDERKDGLYDLLKRIASLERAPRTRKGNYPTPTSPYKPIMLLVVLRRLQQARAPYAENRMVYEVCEQDFEELYSRLFGGSGDIGTKASQAFWYLGAGSPKMWTLVAPSGSEESLANHLATKTQVKTVSKLAQLVSLARFSDVDWALLTDSDVQRALMSFLMAEHFPDVRREIQQL